MFLVYDNQRHFFTGHGCPVESFVSTREVIYTEDDVHHAAYKECSFTLPPNDKGASRILVNWKFVYVLNDRGMYSLNGI